jgi:photosystem II stability/assembly factor-like uncharacterized protein
MKEIKIAIIFLLVLFKTNAQYNENAPWMAVENAEKTANKSGNFDALTTSFNTYWKNKDFTKKGSGFKPFKRWENHWKNYLHKDGSIATPQAIWNAWEQKQKLGEANKNSVSSWKSIGPLTTNTKTGQGRINTFIIDPNNPTTYYVGAPSGGIWKSTDSGINWTPLSDYLPQIGVSGIAIDPKNSNIIYIATGDDDAYDTYSVGVLKSTDAGITWKKTGLDFSDSNSISNEIYIHSSNSNIIWVSTNKGFYKSIDAGVNWTKKLSGNIVDFKLKPGDPNTIYCVGNGFFYKSVNGGDTFDIISSPNLPVKGTSSRMAIDVTPANADYVYLLSAKTDNAFQGVYVSKDSGNTFEKTQETDDIFGGSKQAWYDMAITVSPTNANMVFVGTLDIWRSTDGGNNFIQKNYWYNYTHPAYTHADIHFLRFFNAKLYAGTDGGIYESSTDANSFTDLTENLNISQYYKIATAKNSSSHVVGGLQDNGGFAFSNNIWHNYHGGDGMDCAIDPNNENINYGFTQFGSSLNVTFDGGTTEGVTIAYAPSDEVNGSEDRGGNWVTPLASNRDGVLYAGYSRLYKLVDNMWEAVSEDFFLGDLDNIEIAPSNNAIIYVSKSKNLFKSIDSGATFVQINNDFNFFISSIAINNQNSDIVYVTTSGISGRVYQSSDAGENWIDITKNLPQEPKMVIKHQDRSLVNDLYLGTSLGVYHINDNLDEWEVFDTNLPNVPIQDLEINTDDETITAGTYGRGVWQSSIEVIKANNDISLLTINSNNTINCNGITPIITIKNNGLNAFNKIEINYTIDSESFNYVYNGTINPDEIKEIELPNNSLINYGTHNLEVETIILNDTFEENNRLKSSFTTNISSEGQYINTFGDINPDDWITLNVGSSSQLWQKGVATSILFADKFDNSYTTNSTGAYTDETTSYLVTPCYDLSQMENPLLKFEMIFDIEKDWDVLYMEYTIDNGKTWEILGSANDPNWYNSDFIDPKRPITVGKQWTGTDTTVKEYSYNLASFATTTNIIFRFVFASDQAENGEGVSIDNFTIDATALLAVENLEETNFKVYPNPSNAIFNIKRKYSESMQLSVYDITGKLVHQEKNIETSNYPLNLSGLSQGIYFLKITEGNKQAVKRLLLK